MKDLKHLSDLILNKIKKTDKIADLIILLNHYHYLLCKQGLSDYKLCSIFLFNKNAE